MTNYELRELDLIELKRGLLLLLENNYLGAIQNINSVICRIEGRSDDHHKFIKACNVLDDSVFNGCNRT